MDDSSSPASMCHKVVVGQLRSSRAKEKDMTNAFVHVELNSPDPAKAKAFYASCFGGNWKTCRTLPWPIIPTL
jgi:hypothetical protein